MPSFSIKAILKKVFYWGSIISTIASGFFLFLFPTGDLGDFVSSKVSEVSQNQVFLQFSKFGLDVLPPSLKFEEVFVEAPFLPGVTTHKLSIIPSIGSMITKKPYGSVKAQGLFDGNVSIQLKKGTATDTSPERHRLIIEAEKVQLKSLQEILKLPLQMSGKVDINADAQADLQSTEQPEMDLTFHVADFALPTATVNTMMGPLTLPEFKLGKLDIKGRLSNGQLLIEQGDIGTINKDELYGKVKGHMSLAINPAQGFNPMMGAYEFEIDLTANKAFQSKAGLFLSLLDSYKTANGDNARFHFKVSAANMDAPPNIVPAK